MDADLIADVDVDHRRLRLAYVPAAPRLGAAIGGEVAAAVARLAGAIAADLECGISVRFVVMARQSAAVGAQQGLVRPVAPLAPGLVLVARTETAVGAESEFTVSSSAFRDGRRGRLIAAGELVRTEAAA